MTFFNRQKNILNEFTTKPDRIFKSFGNLRNDKKQSEPGKPVKGRGARRRAGRRSPLAFQVDAIDRLMFGEIEH